MGVMSKVKGLNRLDSRTKPLAERIVVYSCRGLVAPHLDKQFELRIVQLSIITQSDVFKVFGQVLTLDPSIIIGVKL